MTEHKKYVRTQNRILVYGQLYLITVGKKRRGGEIWGFRALTNDTFDYILEDMKETVIKESDDIEELCDKFVWRWSDEHDFIDYKYKEFRNYGWLKDGISEHEKYGYRINEDYCVYGGIWTDEGLIYIAKMNSEGELELL